MLVQKFKKVLLLWGQTRVRRSFWVVSILLNWFQGFLLELLQIEVRHERIAISYQISLSLFNLRFLNFPSLSVFSPEYSWRLMNDEAFLIKSLQFEHWLFTRSLNFEFGDGKYFFFGQLLLFDFLLVLLLDRFDLLLLGFGYELGGCLALLECCLRHRILYYWCYLSRKF